MRGPSLFALLLAGCLHLAPPKMHVFAEQAPPSVDCAAINRVWLGLTIAGGVLGGTSGVGAAVVAGYPDARVPVGIAVSVSAVVAGALGIAAGREAGRYNDSCVTAKP